MANVLFTRAPLSEIENTQTTPYPVTDGQLLFDTSGSGKMYMDVGTQRLEMGGAMTIDSKLNSTSTNPIQNKAVGGVMLSTLDEINAATSKGFITDALATRALAQKIGTTDISSIGDGTCTGAISALNASKVSYTEIQKTSETLTSLNGATGGYQTIIDFSSEVAQLTDSPDYKLIPLGCYQIADNNRVGVLSRIFIDNKAIFRINAGYPSQFNCIMLLIY